MLINPTDYFLYLPLLPEVAAGILEPRRICVSLPDRLPRCTLALGTVDRHRRRRPRGSTGSTPRDGSGRPSYDRLVLAVGSVNKLLPIPGVAEHAHGFRGIPEALYLRDHITRQMELAAATDDPAERDARCTFVVVGAGYTGTEVAAQGQLFTDGWLASSPPLRDQPMRWLLVDTRRPAAAGLSQRLSRTAERVLRERGVEIRHRASVEQAGPDCVRLTTGEEICHPVADLVRRRAPRPAGRALALPTDEGRLEVDETLAVPGHPRRVRLRRLRRGARSHPTGRGDRDDRAARAAAGQAASPATSPPRSGRAGPASRTSITISASSSTWAGARRPRTRCTSRCPGSPAKTVTRGYHLLSLPGNRARTATDWALNTIMPPRPCSSDWSTRDGCRSTARVRLIDRSSRTRALTHPNRSRPLILFSWTGSPA